MLPETPVLEKKEDLKLMTSVFALRNMKKKVKLSRKKEIKRSEWESTKKTAKDNRENQ